MQIRFQALKKFILYLARSYIREFFPGCVQRTSVIFLQCPPNQHCGKILTIEYDGTYIFIETYCIQFWIAPSLRVVPDLQRAPGSFCFSYSLVSSPSGLVLTRLAVGTYCCHNIDNRSLYYLWSQLCTRDNTTVVYSYDYTTQQLSFTYIMLRWSSFKANRDSFLIQSLVHIKGRGNWTPPSFSCSIN